MRITSWNVNGLRAAIRKGFWDHLAEIKPDVLLLQETRVRPQDLPPEVVEPKGWHARWHSADKPGYAGTAVWSRSPLRVSARGIGEADPEGRVLMVSTRGVRIASVYLPSGSSGEHRQRVKDRWLAAMSGWMSPLAGSRSPVILGGDLNVAHTERDIFHWRSNRNTSGFLPHERAWFGATLDAGWHDILREHHPDAEMGPFTWWSNRGRARELDRGWRIDHFLANRAARRRIAGCEVHRDPGRLGVSDHAPVSVDLQTPTP